MYNDAWDDYYDHREDAREDWQDHREDINEERCERAKDAQENRGDRQQNTQQQRTERQQTQQRSDRTAAVGTGGGATARPRRRPAATSTCRRTAPAATRARRRAPHEVGRVLRAIRAANRNAQPASGQREPQQLAQAAADRAGAKARENATWPALQISFTRTARPAVAAALIAWASLALQDATPPPPLNEPLPRRKRRPRR
jgi:hypothetical protein